jgi:protein TonB
MNTYDFRPIDYRVWIPISVLLHVLLLFVLQVAPMDDPRPAVTGEGYIIVPIAEIPVPDIDQAPVAIPPMVPTHQLPRVQPGVPRPAHAGIAPLEGQAPQSRGGGNSVERGPGTEPTAPPEIMHAPTGAQEAPRGITGGTGTGGTSPVASGPTTGPAARGVPHLPTYPKLAQEAGLEGTVVVSVTVNVYGSPQRAVVSKSSGHDELDNAARKAALAWNFLPALKGGEPTIGTVQLSFRFANEQVDGRALEGMAP